MRRFFFLCIVNMSVQSFIILAALYLDADMEVTQAFLRFLVCHTSFPGNVDHILKLA